MKKIFIIAAAALATLASCTKVENEVPQTTGNTISFKAVNYKSQTTKAAGPIAGTTYKTTDPIFGVFGFFLPEGKTWAANSADAQDFMGTSTAALPVSYDDAETVKTWHTADTYYWPFTGSVSFAAYTPFYDNAAATTETVGKPIAATFDKTNGITFTDFKTADKASEQVDLMYSDVVADQKDNTAAGATGNASTYNGVPIVFKHALSQIVFKVKSTTNDLNIDINSISLKLLSKGTFNATDKWGTLSEEVAYSPMVSGDTYMTSASAATETTPAYPEHIDLVKDDFKTLTPLLVIPQELPSTGEGSEKVYNTVAVNYSITQNGVVVTDTIQIPLASVNNTFEIGKKYVFELTFGPKVIYFAPAVTDWVENSGSDVPNTSGAVTINYNKID